MDETRDRLVKCFSAVFPSLTTEAIIRSSAVNTEGWDSMASVTLVATIEEEFGIEIDIQDLEDLVSFDKILNRVRQKATNAENQKLGSQNAI